MYNNDGSSVTERELERIDSQLYTPAQSLQERLGSIHKSAEPAIAGPLSSEFKAILEGKTIDRREFDYVIASGQGITAAFEACASGSLDEELNKLSKVFGTQPIKEQVRVERDKLDDGTFSVSEYDATTGRLLRAYMTADGEPPAEMRR